MTQKEDKPSESPTIEAPGQLHGQLLGFWLLKARSNTLKEIWGPPNKSQTHMLCLQFEISNKNIVRDTCIGIPQRKNEGECLPGPSDWFSMTIFTILPRDSPHC